MLILQSLMTSFHVMLFVMKKNSLSLNIVIFVHLFATEDKKTNMI